MRKQQTRRYAPVSRRLALAALSGGAVALAGCAAAPPSAVEGSASSSASSAAGSVVQAQAAAPQVASGPPLTINKWLVLDPQTARNWRAAPDPSDPLRVTLTRRTAFAGPPKRLLVFYPKAGSAFDLGLNTIIGDMDLRRIPCMVTVVNWNEQAARIAAALATARTDHTDLIISDGSDSTLYLHDHYLGGPIPVVTVESKDPVIMGQIAGYDKGSGSNIAYTSVGVPVSIQMTYLAELKPKLANIAPLYEKSDTSAVQTQVDPIRAACKQSGITMLDVAVVDANNVVNELKQKMADAIVQMKRTDPTLANSIFLVTGSTAVFTAIATINQAAGDVPVVSMFPELVTQGEDSAALSIGVSFQTNAHLAALYVAEILQGKATAGSLKVGVVTPPDIAISFLKADQIGLRIPFAFFESASTVYDTRGKLVRSAGETVSAT